MCYGCLMTGDDKLCVSFTQLGNNITDFSIQLLSNIDGKWKEIFRVDTENHGDVNKQGLAHTHRFYMHKSENYRMLVGKRDGNFSAQYKFWLKDIRKRAKYYKENYFHNK